jgi:hypothetical protein
LVIKRRGTIRQISELETTLTHFLDWNKTEISWKLS